MLSRMTPRLLTWGESETEELSIVKEKLTVLDKVDLVPMRRTSVLLLFKEILGEPVFYFRNAISKEGGVTDGIKGCTQVEEDILLIQFN